ncbi:hypothetical protein FIA58_003310 [Flavobacterium jejuense]|uniref:Lipoprotein n=1 Tax=Flavobacterium jejuense TaxID=1544455 RepID=A0ABX0IPG8_9FLAO|nr:hypothetical protein [Flavobacterium jejuense]NHN24694.1 hypothetical protein [Flavobacterium jejuense]
MRDKRNHLSILLVLLIYFSCKNESRDPVINKIGRNENQLDTLLNTNDYLILGKKTTKVKVVQKDKIDDFPTYEVLIGYRDDVIIAEKISFNEVEIYRKNNPKTFFEDYKVAIYKGKLSEPDFSTNLQAKRFKTNIKKECANGINFAGHYTLITWGCGSPCQSGVLVDRKTGKIYGGYGTSLGSKFKKDSRMIIKNIGALDTITNLIKVCAYCEVSQEIWTDTEFKVVE